MTVTKTFLNEDFLLQNEIACELYHDYAATMPIIDYHCHLSSKDIAENRKFNNLTEIWLEGDHYKWRAMRANGVAEKYITGDASDWEKFEAWAATVPYTLRNPLYHWTHMELKRPFGIDTILSQKNAREVYDECSTLLQTADYQVQGILKQMNVEVICTTDDPTDNLAFHQKIKDYPFGVRILPAFRPDKAILIENEGFNAYIEKLSEVSGIQITTFDKLLEALHQRMDFFASMGCNISDHGLEQIYATDFTPTEINVIFSKKINNQSITHSEALQYQSAILYQLGIAYAERNWVQQWHLGALRNNNKRMLRQLGPDTGWDSIGDFEQTKNLSSFFDRLDDKNKLAKTILYNLNPRDNEAMATMIGNFNDGSIAGKMQFGSAWWFLDQKDGMEKQINALSNMGLLSRFVGMLTDSRSFLSYPRHEYFRRILCNIFAKDIENGELPNDIEWTGKIIQDICYYNAKNYFGY
jgi:glucuronate isomerase